MEHNDDLITTDVTKLRKEKRPLWMTNLGVDNLADMVGGGGDIWTDRLAPEWQRNQGEELSDEEAQNFSEETAQMSGEFPPKSELTSTVEEAFKYMHQSEEQPTSLEAEASSSEESGTTGKEKSKGLGLKLGVGVNADVKLS